MIKTHKIILSASLAMLCLPATTTVAQTPTVTALEEIVVTGRKRAESLTDVPVSISVFDEDLLFQAGIATQDDLFAATVGLDLGIRNGTRTDNSPGVRGVQSTVRLASQQKVNSFIDGLPMLGNTGTLTFAGVDAVEVYRGPQSAAFGRSTFAGAINYVTSDSSEEFEGRVTVKATDLNSQEVGLIVSGPLTDRFGYRLSYVNSDDKGPEAWRTAEGNDLSRQETERVTAKLNFEFSDSAYGELMYSHAETFDQSGAGWGVDLASCGPSTNIFRGSRGGTLALPVGVWDCDPSAPAGGPIRNYNAYDQFVAQYDVAAYTAQALINESTVPAGMGGMGGGAPVPPPFASADVNTDGEVSLQEFLAQTDIQGATYEQLLISQSIVTPGWREERDRVQGELNFEVGDSLLQFLAMYSEEDFYRRSDSDNTDSVGEFNRGALGANLMSRLILGDIEEQYAEVRWVSPEDERLRYTLSGTYYDYTNNLLNFAAYNAILQGLVIESGINAGVARQPG